MIAQWNAPISDRFSSLCARVFSPAAAILESEKTLGTRLKLRLIVMSTNLEYRARESGRQVSEAQRGKGR